MVTVILFGLEKHTDQNPSHASHVHSSLSRTQTTKLILVHDKTPPFIWRFTIGFCHKPLLGVRSGLIFPFSLFSANQDTKRFPLGIAMIANSTKKTAKKYFKSWWKWSSTIWTHSRRHCSRLRDKSTRSPSLHLSTSWHHLGAEWKDKREGIVREKKREKNLRLRHISMSRRTKGLPSPQRKTAVEKNSCFPQHTGSSDRPQALLLTQVAHNFFWLAQLSVQQDPCSST